jgi:sugar/nucleoside kinase (ribokinase family)
VPATDLLTVGHGHEDLVFAGLEHLPGPGDEVRTTSFVHTVGGGAIVTAVAAARLGLQCEVVSGLSASAVSRVRAEHVLVTNLKHPDEPHAITAALSTRVDRSFVTFAGINEQLEGRLFDAVARPDTRHVHFAFYPHDCGRWEATVSSLRAHGITTSWDFGVNDGLLRDRRFPHLVNSLDYVLLSERETLLYSRRPTLQAAVEVWRAHPRHVVVKMGTRGSRWISAGADLHVPAKRVRSFDTTGAGDAFNGGFLFGVVRGKPPRICLRLGNFVSAMATRMAGGIDALPRPRELPKGLAVHLA